MRRHRQPAPFKGPVFPVLAPRVFAEAVAGREGPGERQAEGPRGGGRALTMTAETVLRTWGMHWRARMEGCPKERLGRDAEVLELQEGDALAHIEAMRALHPRLGYEEAVEAVKYGPSAKCHPLSYELPEMAQIERDVSMACLAVGTVLWERYWAENGRYPVFDGSPSNRWQGEKMARFGVRFLVRQVYVLGCTSLRSKWPGSSFDFLYPYAEQRPDRRRSGRESTIGLVKAEIDSKGSAAFFEPGEKIYGT